MSTYNKEIIDEICIDDFLITKKNSKAKRELLVEKFMNLPGTLKKPQHHLIYKSPNSSFKIFVEKPGKEAKRETDKNPYDLRIYIKKNNKEIKIGKSFKEIFKSFEYVKNNEKALDLMAYIFIRNAYCYDHNDLSEYSPSKIIIEEIQKDLKEIHDLPIDIFLYFLDLIATNEDVKYSNKDNKNTGKKIYSLGQGTGRRNNLLTYVNVIALLQNKIFMWELAGALVSGAPGVAPIDNKGLFKNFPLMNKKT